MDRVGGRDRRRCGAELDAHGVGLSGKSRPLVVEELQKARGGAARAEHG